MVEVVQTLIFTVQGTSQDTLVKITAFTLKAVGNHESVFNWQLVRSDLYFFNQR